MGKTSEVFPADDAVARFMVAMWAARNDIGYTAERVGQANTKDAPEFFYLVRLLFSPRK
jgi:hypothetical protein